jgi:putative flippase GtrA
VIPGRSPDAARMPVARRAARIDIVVPVFNEQAVLVRSIGRLHAYLLAHFDHDWRIVIVDNASIDATPRIADDLARGLPGVQAIHLSEKGRGRALRTAWWASDADVVAYMDVDLSTDLRALQPLVAPLLSGHSEVAIGTRLASGSHVTRGPRRELISRAYNRILRVSLRARFSDAQCGFKSLRADAARTLLPEVVDQDWFFDTELLVAAQRRGMRIHEVAVDWVDDPDSRVRILATALADLRGVLRLRFASALSRFLAIGAASTLAYLLLYCALRGAGTATMSANAIALAVTTVANTQANHSWTFRPRACDTLMRQHAGAALGYAITLGLTEGALALGHGLDPRVDRLSGLAVLITASLVAITTSYAALRTGIFARAPRSQPVLRRLARLQSRRPSRGGERPADQMVEAGRDFAVSAAMSPLEQSRRGGCSPPKAM